MNGDHNDGFEKPENAHAAPRLAARKEVVEVEGTRRWLFGWALGFAGLLTAAVLLLSSCGGEAESAGSGEETPPPGEEAESAGRAAGVSVADVTDNPSEFYGKKLTLSGLVTEKVGPHSIAIGGDDAFGGEPVLIVGVGKKLEAMAKGLPDSEVAEIQQRSLAQLTGTLRELDVKKIEEEIGYELDENVLAAWEGEPVLLAKEVVLTPRRDGDAAQARQGVDVTLPMIADAPEEFYGQSVTAKGVVARVVNPNVFVMVDERVAREEEVFDDVDSPGSLVERGVVVATNEGPVPDEKQAVWVTGRVQRFDVDDLERRLGASFDEDAEVLSTFQENEGPAVVASEIRRQTQGGETTSQ